MRGRILMTMAVLTAGCGGGEAADRPAELTVYSSLPLQGALRANTTDAVKGMRLALEEWGGQAGGARVRLVSLDDSSASTGNWEAGQVSANARRAVRDRSAVAYIGEANSGATAVALPITNEAELLQVSPGSTYGGLTREGSYGAGEPGKYYPTGRRTFGRIIPADHIQARAVLAYLRHEGIRAVHLLHDRDSYGHGLTGEIERAARGAGIEVLGHDGIDVRAGNFRGLAERVKGADAVFFGGSAQSRAAQLAKDVLAADDRVLFFSPDATVDPSYTRALGGRLERRARLTLPVLPAASLPPAGRRFLRRFERKYGRAPQPAAIYGYEAMALVLSAIDRAETTAREDIVESFFATRDRESVLGTYSIDERGDTTASAYGGYRVEDGRLAFDRVLTG